jgi:hypothetical protein
VELEAMLRLKEEEKTKEKNNNRYPIIKEIHQEHKWISKDNYSSKMKRSRNSSNRTLKSMKPWQMKTLS